MLALSATPVSAQCPAPDQWVDKAGTAVPPARALGQLGTARAVLLGEQHATPAHHVWQRDVIAALAARGPVVIGLEQLPVSAQPALDKWVAGDLDEPAFLAESRWAERWGHDFAAYRPIFELARTNAIPMRALNADRAFVRKVGKQGFDSAAADGKAPISRPATPPPAYVAKLEDSFRQHMKTASPEALARFVEAQTVWDRAMAETIVKTLIERPSSRVVAIMGWGHVADGHGVAHQLKSLGVADSALAIPVKGGAGCEPRPESADFSFGIQP
jgi:uncharacterized iron-regulated protein